MCLSVCLCGCDRENVGHSLDARILIFQHRFSRVAHKKIFSDLYMTLAHKTAYVVGKQCHPKHTRSLRPTIINKKQTNKP